jgi:hypothetical protein
MVGPRRHVDATKEGITMQGWRDFVNEIVEDGVEIPSISQMAEVFPELQLLADQMQAGNEEQDGQREAT